MVEAVLFHLKHHVKTKMGVSPIHGVGMFAIRNIKKSEVIFPDWVFKSGIYAIPNDRLIELPPAVLDLISIYFTNEECGYKGVKLFEGMNFICNSLSYCNSSWPEPQNTNIDNQGLATRDIKSGDEILMWYEIERTPDGMDKESINR